MQRIREWKLQETLGHPYNSTIHTCTHTYACLHFNKAKLFSLWRRTSCTYDSNASSMYYIQPVTVRRSITQRIAIITSNHLLPGIFDISRYTWQLSLWSGNAAERGTASVRISTRKCMDTGIQIIDDERTIQTNCYLLLYLYSFVASASWRILIFFFLSSRMITFDSLKMLNFRKIHHLWI